MALRVRKPLPYSFTVCINRLVLNSSGAKMRARFAEYFIHKRWVEQAAELVVQIKPHKCNRIQILSCVPSLHLPNPSEITVQIKCRWGFSQLVITCR